MIHSLDFLVVTAFVFVQWRITKLLLRSAAKRYRGAALAAARASIFALDAVLLAGYVLSFSELLSRLHAPSRVGSFLAAGALIYLLLATAGLLLRVLTRVALRRWNSDADPGRRRVIQLAGNVAMAAPAAVLGYGAFIQRLDFQVREVDVPLPRLPADLDGLRILQLSDIHRGPFLADRDLGKVIDASLELRPNLAVVTGDLISSRGDPLDSCIRQLARLRADAGVFGCMGNHERYADAVEYTEAAAARVGIRFLRLRSQSLRFGAATLNLAGVDYQQKTEKERYLRGAERLIEPGAVNVLLSHNPDVFPVAARQGYNLLLAGHTHGGQVVVEILDQSINPARFFTPYVYGLYRAGDAAGYVTRGIGTIGLPARIGAPPEISVLRLRKVEAPPPVRYLILSDLHANREALDAVLEHAEGRYDRSICCGDLVGYGADPNPIVEWVRANCSVTVRGNHDKACTGVDDLEWFNPIAKEAALWTQRNLTPENAEWTRALPKGPLTADRFQVAHGSLFDEDEYLLAADEAGQAFGYMETRIAFFGHTHVQGGFIWNHSRVETIPRTSSRTDRQILEIDPDCAYLVNPGSVGQPRDGDPRAAYSLYDSDAGMVTYFRVSYDMDTAQQKIRNAGLPTILAERLLVGR